MTDNLLRNFTHITIPAEIWLRRDVSIQAKVLWAELRSLHNKQAGGCFASDEYLMEFMALKRSRLHELYKELKDKNLMEIVSFNGRQTIRRALVPEIEYKESPDTSYPPTGQQVSGKPDTYCPENRIEGVPAHNIYNKEDNKEYNTQGDGVEKKPSSNLKNKISHGTHVKLLPDEYAKLCENHSKDEIDNLITQMNDYCAAKGTSYKDYAAALRQWIIRRKENSGKINEKPRISFDQSQSSKPKFKSRNVLSIERNPGGTNE